MSAWNDNREDPKAALPGLRILDFSRVLAGPFATMVLADLGADVIKVERPGSGDDTRAWGPPYDAGGRSTYFDAVNRNKRSVALDFASPAGLAHAKALAAEADVLVENFRPGLLDGIGLGYADLQTINPRLIYCSITGFGQDGPYKTRAGYDLLVQGMGGIMDITGDPKGEPTRLGVAFADVFTGTYSALAICAALKEREATGKGAQIDMALMDTMVGVLANQATYYLVSGTPPVRMGNAHASVVPYQTFPTKDGWMLIACGNDGQFAKMMQVLGDAAMADDERYKTNAARVVNRESLIPRLFELTRKLSKQELAEQFEAVGVPAGPINTLREVFDDPQVKARGMRVDLPHPDAKGGMLPGVRTPITINGRRAAADRAPPKVGEHTQEVLREIGEA